MPKRSSEPLERVHLTLFESDMNWLRLHYASNVGISEFVRVIVRHTIKKMEELANARKRAIPLGDLDFPDLPEEDLHDN